MNVMTLYLKTSKWDWSTWTSSCRRSGGRTLTLALSYWIKVERATTCSCRSLIGGKKLLNRVGKFSHSSLCMLESVMNSVTQLWALRPSWVHLCPNVAVSLWHWLRYREKAVVCNISKRVSHNFEDERKRRRKWQTLTNKRPTCVAEIIEN